MEDIQGVDASYESRPAIERASSADLAFVAMDRGKVPEQFAVILQLEQSGDLRLHQLRQLIEARICALPRLRQRLINVPPGFGRPVWVDDHDFRIERHVLLDPPQHIARSRTKCWRGLKNRSSSSACLLFFGAVEEKTRFTNVFWFEPDSTNRSPC